MKTQPSTKWILTRLALPVAVVAIMLVSCNNKANSSNDKQTQPVVKNNTTQIDSLLKENRKLTDSLNVVNERLDSCEAARKKRCPCPGNTVKPTPVKPAPVKPAPVKPAPVAPTPVTQPATNQITIDNNNAGNNAVVIGNNNHVNNVVINGCTEIVLDTLGQVQTTRRIMSGYAKTTYTYTK